MERIIGEDIKKNTSMSNRIISFIGKVFVVIWVGSSALWSKPISYHPGIPDETQPSAHYSGSLKTVLTFLSVLKSHHNSDFFFVPY